jgi:hypothetical protein
MFGGGSAVDLRTSDITVSRAFAPKALSRVNFARLVRFDGRDETALPAEAAKLLTDSTAPR